MSAVVETWVTKLTKLKEKVRPKKPSLLLSKAKGGVVMEEEEEEREAEKESKVVHRESAMSEATVCMLMDRYGGMLRWLMGFAQDGEDLLFDPRGNCN
ncbi:hypothetical protein GH714_041925 [Hevea brasiliensis]|uniref:Uncharacterized protein n=1 Tax=Hevea brasiliensis TaxID=3981 RepID=A0A6A6MTU3_HEVBR|nr:hypothetical protein GH714_041925 [Hevea brasiliensis]